MLVSKTTCFSVWTEAESTKLHCGGFSLNKLWKCRFVFSNVLKKKILWKWKRKDSGRRQELSVPLDRWLNRTTSAADTSWSLNTQVRVMPAAENKYWSESRSDCCLQWELEVNYFCFSAFVQSAFYSEKNESHSQRLKLRSEDQKLSLISGEVQITLMIIWKHVMMILW